MNGLEDIINSYHRVSKKNFFMVGLFIVVFNISLSHFLIEGGITGWGKLLSFDSVGDARSFIISLLYYLILREMNSSAIGYGYAISENKRLIEKRRLFYIIPSSFHNGFIIFLILIPYSVIHYSLLIATSGLSIFLGVLVYFALFPVFANVIVFGWSKKSFSLTYLEDTLRDKKHPILCILTYVCNAILVPIIVIIIGGLLIGLLIVFNNHIYSLSDSALVVTSVIIISFLYNSFRTFVYSIGLNAIYTNHKKNINNH